MKYLWILLFTILGAALVFWIYLTYVLPDTGPAPEIQVEITPERIERGEYLANHVMVCADCHSMRDFSKFSAPITGSAFSGGGDEFTEEFGLPGNFYASNLTPFYLKDWTDGEIFRAITSGVSKDGRALFPVMPYPLYNQASEEDIFAIIAYLRSLPPVENTVEASKAKFPVSLLINTMPVKYSSPVKPDETDILKYGKYMATVAGCIECHTPMEKGKPLWDEAFSGGREFLLPGGVLTTSNLTPDVETGIGNWNEEMFIFRFKAFADSTYTPHSVDPEKDFNTLMPWTMYADMKESDLRAIYAYLKTLEPVKKQITLFAPNN
jgi:mono/diheme cytochrome c family protein